MGMGLMVHWLHVVDLSRCGMRYVCLVIQQHRCHYSELLLGQDSNAWHLANVRVIIKLGKFAVHWCGQELQWNAYCPSPHTWCHRLPGLH